MPLRSKLVQKATDADAAHSRMSFNLSSGQEDKDGALKLVSNSAVTNAQAQWLKAGTERRRRILVGLFAHRRRR